MNAPTGSEPCPLCEADALDCLTRSRNFDRDGVQFRVDGLEYALCRECGAITTTPAQSRRNKRLIVAAHKAAAGLLTGAQIAALRKQRLGGVSQQVMAAVLGVGVNTFSRYETDAVIQSDAMNSLLVVLDAYPEAFQTLAKRRGVMLEPAAPKAHEAAAVIYTKLFQFMDLVATRYEPEHKAELVKVVTFSGTTPKPRVVAQGQPRLKTGVLYG